MCAGTYEFEDGDKIEFRAEERGLSIVSGPGRRLLDFESGERFVDRSRNWTYQFMTEGSEGISAVTRKAGRDGERAGRTPVPSLFLDSRERATYEGLFEIEPETTLTIFSDGPELFLRSTSYGKFRFRLDHEGNGLFAVVPVDVPFGVPQTKISFSSGTTDSLEILRLAGVIRATRIGSGR